MILNNKEGNALLSLYITGQDMHHFGSWRRQVCTIIYTRMNFLSERYCRGTYHTYPSVDWLRCFGFQRHSEAFIEFSKILANQLLSDCSITHNILDMLRINTIDTFHISIVSILVYLVHYGCSRLIVAFQQVHRRIAILTR